MKPPNHGVVVNLRIVRESILGYLVLSYRPEPLSYQRTGLRFKPLGVSGIYSIWKTDRIEMVY